jgi:hypothetical protein
MQTFATESTLTWYCFRCLSQNGEALANDALYETVGDAPAGER